MNNAIIETPFLIAQGGELNNQRWLLEHTLLIGRGPDCDIVIPSRQVSRHHARLTREGHQVLLEDLGSKNGTFCNGQPIRIATVLQDGDVLQIALAQQFLFLESDITMALEAELPQDRLQTTRSPVLEHDRRVHLDSRTRRVWVLGREVTPPLSASQFTLLERLYTNDGAVISRPDLITAVWGEEGAIGVSDQALDALIRRLRDRLAECDPTYTYVVTVRGHGLRLDNPKQ
ncbi:MAG: hypothetical protein Fur0018_13380 [Anaerolineales bacterium]